MSISKIVTALFYIFVASPAASHEVSLDLTGATSVVGAIDGQLTAAEAQRVASLHPNGMLALPASVAAQDTTNGWALLAKADVQAIHDILATSHPGPADPLNPAYGQRVEIGRREALSRAEEARSYGDYIRTLRAYTNGFRDGHIGLSADLSPNPRWPRFAVAPAEDTVRVAEAEAASGVQVGDAVLACDGQNVDTLMKERIDPYWWNTDIPHERGVHAPRLFLSAAGEEGLEFKSCRVRDVNGEERDVALSWGGLDAAKARSIASGVTSPRPLGLRQVDGIWIVDLPTFQLTAVQVAEATRLVEDLTGRADELADATVVFDVRGNRGGNSVWGSRVARAVWGAEAVAHVVSGFDNTVDYRVSPANIAALDFNIARYQRDNLPGPMQSTQRIREAMAEALARGKPFLNIPAPPRRAADAQTPASAFHGRAYLLTDKACASACLDFADIMRRLPGVIHIGERTSGDAVYIDNTRAPLPSGLTALSYSLKVYRNRVRANNEWYEPQIESPEPPPSTDEELSAWIRALQS